MVPFWNAVVNPVNNWNLCELIRISDSNTVQAWQLYSAAVWTWPCCIIFLSVFTALRNVTSHTWFQGCKFHLTVGGDNKYKWPYGANFVPIFIKQIQCFANKHNLLCKEKLDFQTNAKWFANTKLYLRENAEVWTNICIVCYNCETRLPFYEETWLDFLTRVQADFLTRAIEQLSFPKTADDAVGQFTLVSRDPKHLFTFSDQYEWGTGEFLSYYLYN